MCTSPLPLSRIWTVSCLLLLLASAVSAPACRHPGPPVCARSALDSSKAPGFWLASRLAAPAALQPESAWAFAESRTSRWLHSFYQPPPPILEGDLDLGVFSTPSLLAPGHLTTTEAAHACPPSRLHALVTTADRTHCHHPPSDALVAASRPSPACARRRARLPPESDVRRGPSSPVTSDL